MDSWNASETDNVECCCEHIQLGRCFGFNGEGIAQCDSFLSDSVATCHSLFDNNNLSMTFECNVQENCPRIGEDYFPYKPFLDWGLVFLFVCPCIIPCLYCSNPLDYICFVFKINGSAIYDGTDEVKLSSMKTAFGIAITFAISMIILACTQLDYEQTMYAVIGIIGSFVLIFVALNMIACETDKISEQNVTVEATNVYQDLSNSLCLVLSMSFCQIGLLGIYVYSLVTEGAPNYSEPSTFLYYLLGSFIQIAMGTKEALMAQSGNANEYEFWVQVGSCTTKKTKDLRLTVLGEDMGYDEWGDKLFLKSPRWFRSIRLFLSIVINFLGKSLVTYLLPIHLAHSGSAMDFILNSIAAYFIMEMDDYANSRSLVIHNENFEDNNDDHRDEHRKSKVIEDDEKNAGQKEGHQDKAHIFSSGKRNSSNGSKTLLELTERQESEGRDATTEPLISREDDEKNAGRKEGQDKAHRSEIMQAGGAGDDLETGNRTDGRDGMEPLIREDDEKNEEGQDKAHNSSEIMQVEGGDDLETGNSPDVDPSKMSRTEKAERRTLSKSSQDVWKNECGSSV